MDGFFTWAMLATYAGATVATGAVTQFLKGTFTKLPTQILSYLIALVVLLAATFFTGALTLQSGVLCLFNAVVVSLASNGGYEALKNAAKPE